MQNNKDQNVVSSLLMFTIFVLLILAMTACSTTVPVTAKFPEPPKYSGTACPQLQTVPDDVKLSGLTSTVTMNYSTYYECSVKVDSWREWYEIQKRIFEGVK